MKKVTRLHQSFTRSTFAGGGVGVPTSRKKPGLKSQQHLNAMVSSITHDHAPVCVDGDAAPGVIELARAATLAADGAHVRSVRVIQHLHAVITILGHDQMTGAVKRQTMRKVELAIACALLADGPQVLPIAVP